MSTRGINWSGPTHIVATPAAGFPADRHSEAVQAYEAWCANRTRIVLARAPLSTWQRIVRWVRS